MMKENHISDCSNVQITRRGKLEISHRFLRALQEGGRYFEISAST